jgi:8-oxo-dGTP pyrophosphatase MutT (NUDIX family)
MEKIHVIARAYIRDGDKILLADNGKNLFLPGGHVKCNESIPAALRRELYEELGLEDITVQAFVGIIENSWSYKGNPFHETNFIFQVVCPNLSANMNITSKENHIQFHWIAFKDLEKHIFLPDKIALLLRHFDQDRKAKFHTTLENQTF